MWCNSTHVQKDKEYQALLFVLNHYHRLLDFVQLVNLVYMALNSATLL